ncbi:hypothetical protein H257_00811 [Aphanomyces astaci]|uniref:Uncharacterized protein n=1 Tax=Aphanomyces astaci TaxID=112090 RepID=W4HCG4_APHAT|nr:hypothetical protein H257_00811 [Aphanomyces astaci]ETV89597.1 hypothetical protein H257_00811 [Aphanomyces astaci]|eukprot:XP_009821997.1 hypothetical protein H257_00811 [Aphanomyces astaci]
MHVALYLSCQPPRAIPCGRVFARVLHRCYWHELDGVLHVYVHRSFLRPPSSTLDEVPWRVTDSVRRCVRCHHRRLVHSLHFRLDSIYRNSYRRNHSVLPIRLVEDNAGPCRSTSPFKGTSSVVYVWLSWPHVVVSPRAHTSALRRDIFTRGSGAWCIGVGLASSLTFGYVYLARRQDPLAFSVALESSSELLAIVCQLLYMGTLPTDHPDFKLQSEL